MDTHKSDPTRSADRRASARIELAHGARVRRQGSTRSIPARTRNASDGGLLLEIAAGPEALTLGAQVEVLVARFGEPLVRSASFVPARVVRVAQDAQGCSLVALRFDEAGAIATAA